MIKRKIYLNTMGKRALLIIFIVSIFFCYQLPIYATSTENQKAKLITTKLGIGGGGALFEPAISPINSNEMLVVPDMGGIYISHNKGEKWDRANLYGTVMSATYDPNREGIIYAGGSGLWRSNDNGRTFNLLFPKEDDVKARLTYNENALQYYFTKSGLYDRNKYVKNILIDPDDSNHIFVLCYSSREGIIFESTDNGEEFKKLFTYQKENSTSKSVQFDFNELIYRKETKDIFAIFDEKIISYNLETQEKNIIYESNLGLVDVSTVFENDKTYFIIIEKTDELAESNTKVYYTNDFVNKVDITDKLISTKPTYFDNNKYGNVTYKYDFHYISATSLNNIYVTNWTYQTPVKIYPYAIDGIIRYHNDECTYLYGNPFYNHNNLASRSWNDGNTYSLGISASKQNEDEFMFTTLCGVYYAPDNEHIYPKHTTVIEGKYPNGKYVTNGIDEQTTYGVLEDPFNEDSLLLLNTDLGLIRSEDNGRSWVLANKGIPSNWVNTIYDAAFDEKKEGIVYSLWSGRHDAPYSPGNETDNRHGGFAISTDGGKNWNANYSSGLPENVVPLKMSVVYPENSNEVTIYVATFNKGFFVSYDSGKNFSEMNNGIERVSYKTGEDYQYILATDIEVKDGKMFGITAKSTYNGGTQEGNLYEYKNGMWINIALPQNVITPRDIYYNDGVLYISGTAKGIWDSKNGLAFNNYGGGVYTYKDGEFNQIFDEKISTTSVQIDSKGTLYISDLDGNIYRKEIDKDYERIYDSYHYKSKGLQLTQNGDCLYLATLGGGVLRIENLNSLYTNTSAGEIPEIDKDDDTNPPNENGDDQDTNFDDTNNELNFDDKELNSNNINNEAYEQEDNNYKDRGLFNLGNLPQAGEILPRGLLGILIFEIMSVMYSVLKLKSINLRLKKSKH